MWLIGNLILLECFFVVKGFKILLFLFNFILDMFFLCFASLLV